MRSALRKNDSFPGVTHFNRPAILSSLMDSLAGQYAFVLDAYPLLEELSPEAGVLADHPRHLLVRYALGAPLEGELSLLFRLAEDLGFLDASVSRFLKRKLVSDGGNDVPVAGSQPSSRHDS